jgi:hypothetical protein
METLSGYSAENYKAFVEPVDIEVRPLTLLFGYNSSGKSALLRLLPLLRDSILSVGKRPLAMASKAARGASFEDVKSQFSSSPVVSLGLRWEKKERGHREFGSARFSIRDLSDFRTQIVERFMFGSKDEIFEFEWIPSSKAERGFSSTMDRSLPSRYLARRYQGGSVRELLLRFDGLVPSLHQQGSPEFQGYLSDDLDQSVREFQGPLGDLAGSLQNLARGVHWLQPLRNLPLRREDLVGLSGSLSPDGAEITQMLLEDDSRGGPVLEEVSKWYEVTTGHRLELRRGTFAGKDLFSFLLMPLATKLRGIEIVDTGEGMGQVLPVVSLLAFAKHDKLGPSPILSIEHPELHLHTSAHADLAALFCDVARARENARLIVETHSENFLLRVQLAMARGELDPARVIVYWVRSSESGPSVVDKIEFDNLGRPVGDRWPPGVFAETLDQSRELLRTRQAIESK